VALLEMKLLGVFDLFGDANSSTLILLALPNKLDCVELIYPL